MGRLGDALDEFDGTQSVQTLAPPSPGPSKLGAALDAFDAGTDTASLFVAPPLAQTADRVRGFLDTPQTEIVSTDIPPETDIRGVPLSLPGPKFPKGTPKDIRVSEASDKRIGFVESFKKEVTGVKGLTKFPILGGIAGAAENVDLIQSANRLANPDFDYSKVFRGRIASISGDRPTFKFSKETDKKRIAEFLKNLNEEQERGFTFGGKVAKGITALPTWMIEFAMTGGLASLGDDIATIAGRKLIGRYVKTKAGAAALKAAGITGGALVRATVGLPTRIAEQATGRQVLSDLQVTEQEDWATSITKAWGDTVIEAASEETGAIISKGLGKVASKLIGKLPRGKKFLTELSKAWVKTTGGKEAEFVKKISTRAGYSNMIGEIGEERLGTILREATGVSDREGNFVQRIAAGLQEDFTPSNLGVEAVTLAVPGAAKKIASKVISFRDIPVTDAEGQVLEPEPVAEPTKQVETLADIPKIEPTQPTGKETPITPTVTPPKATQAKPGALKEEVVSAVVRIDGKVFEGETHAQAVQKAVDEGVVRFNEDGILEAVGKPDAEIESDLFKTSKDKIIDRLGAKKISGQIQAEAIKTIPKTQPEAVEGEVVKFVAEKGEQLSLSETTERESEFKTGQSVTFEFIRNTEKSPNLGSRFQQDIEPAGKFMTIKPSTFKEIEGQTFEQGKVTFESPLVLEFNSEDGGFDENSWKAKLSESFDGKTGVELSQAIRDAGFDGIVTVGKRGETSEIVDLSVIKPTPTAEEKKLQSMKKRGVTVVEGEEQIKEVIAGKKREQLKAAKPAHPKFAVKAAKKAKEAISEPIQSDTNSKKATLEVEKEAKVLLPIEVNASDIDFKTARDAHNNLSHFPERAAYITQRDYLNTMQNVYNDLKGAIKTDADKSIVTETMETIKEGYIKRQMDILGRKRNTASSFITGPANFPAASMNKKNEMIHRRTDELFEWIDKVKASARKKINKAAIEAAGGEVAVFEKELATAEKNQETMKAINAIVRKKGSDAEKISKIIAQTDFTKAQAEKLLKPDRGERVGFQGFQLTNNRAKIKRMQERLAIMKKAESRSGKKIIGVFDGGEIFNNFDLERVQIVFDEKPNDTVRTALKSRGFRWSPKNNAWQRKNTPNGLSATKQVIEENYTGLKRILLDLDAPSKPKTKFTPDPTIEVKAKGEPGFAGVSDRPGGKIQKPSLTLKKTKSPDKEIENFFGRTERLPGKFNLRRIMDRVKFTLRGAFVTQTPHLKTTPETAFVRDMIRTMPDQQRAAREKAVTDILAVLQNDGSVRSLDHAGLDLLRRKVFVQDLLTEAKIDRSVSGDLSLGQLEAENDRLDSLINQTPSVKKAFASRQKLWKNVSQDLFNRGVLNEESRDNVSYVRHFVIDYINNNRRPVSPKRRKLSEPYRSYKQKRKGSKKDISTDYLAVEVRALADIYADNVIEDIANDIARTKDRKAEFKKTAKEKGIPVRDVAASEGHIEWNYKRPNMFYRAITLDQAKIAAMIEENAVDAGDTLNIPKSMMNEALVLGRREGLYIPEDLARQLDNLPVNYRGHPIIEGMSAISKNVIQWWKRWILRINPFRYNARNQLGDTERVIASGQQSALKRIPQATKMLIKKEGEFYESAKEFGVIGSSLWHEMGDVSKLKEFEKFKNFTDRKTFKRFAKNVLLGPLRAISRVGTLEQDLTQLREDVLRLAVYIESLEKLRAGKEVRHWAGSIADIDALAKESKERAAAKISRETLIDYGSFTIFEDKVLRNGLIPFYSFKKKNLTFWPRALVNSAKEGTAGKTAAIAASRGAFNIAAWLIRIMGAYGIGWLWNHINDDNIKKEEKMPFWLRARPHLVIGDKVLWGDTALADFGEWVDFESLLSVVWRHQAGYLDKNEAAMEAAKVIGQAPFNSFAQALNPFIKGAGTAVFGQTVYPDIFNPRYVKGNRFNAAVLSVLGTDAKKFFESATGDRRIEDTLYAYFAGWWVKPNDPETVAENIRNSLERTALKKKSPVTGRKAGEAKKGQESRFQEAKIREQSLSIREKALLKLRTKEAAIAKKEAKRAAKAKARAEARNR